MPEVAGGDPDKYSGQVNGHKSQESPGRVLAPASAPSILACQLGTGGTTHWTVHLCATFLLPAAQLIPAIELLPATEPAIDSVRLTAAVLDRRRGAEFAELLTSFELNEERVEFDPDERVLSTQHLMLVTVSKRDELRAWRQFCGKRTAELAKTKGRGSRLQGLLRRWQTTTPWALAVPDVLDELRSRLGIDARLSDLDAALHILRSVKPSRGAPAITANIPSIRRQREGDRPWASEVGVRHALERRRADRRIGAVGMDLALDRLLGPDRAPTALIDRQWRRFRQDSEDQVIKPILVPFCEDAVPLPLEEIADAFGCPGSQLRPEQLHHALIAAGRPKNGSQIPIWRSEWTLPEAVEAAVVPLLNRFTLARLRQWASEPEMVGRLTLIAGGLPRLRRVELMSDFHPAASLEEVLHPDEPSHRRRTTGSA